MPETFDLDAARAARAEQTREPKEFTFGGEHYELPVECPFDFIRWLGVNDHIAMSALLGPDQYERFMAVSPPPTVDDVSDLVAFVAKVYGLGGAKNSPASDSSSSNGSRPSKRTSRAATG